MGGKTGKESHRQVSSCRGALADPTQLRSVGRTPALFSLEAREEASSSLRPSIISQGHQGKENTGEPRHFQARQLSVPAGPQRESTAGERDLGRVTTVSPKKKKYRPILQTVVDNDTHRIKNLLWSTGKNSSLRVRHGSEPRCCLSKPWAGHGTSPCFPL